jgi:hypothetical protein
MRAFPDARVVKTLNTVFCEVMIDPTRVPGQHNLFLADDDPAAKETVKGLLGEFGWAADAFIDLGGIQFARGPEMYYSDLSREDFIGFAVALTPDQPASFVLSETGATAERWTGSAGLTSARPRTARCRLSCRT